MLCDECGRNNAVVHIVQIGPNGRTEKNLCRQCAAKYGRYLNNALQGDVHSEEPGDDFLKGIFSDEQEVETPVNGEELVCPNCGMSYRDFQKTGKIGCATCYATFRRQLRPLLRRIHGSSAHRGKIPHRAGGTIELKQEIVALQQKLKDAVADEAFEKAAEYRDRIRSLKEQLAVKEGD